MRAACLSHENSVEVSRSGDRGRTIHLQWAFSPYRGQADNVLPSALTWNLIQLKGLINLWEYNFLFWWTDCTPKLIVRGLSWETGNRQAYRAPTSFTRLFFLTWNDLGETKLKPLSWNMSGYPQLPIKTHQNGQCDGVKMDAAYIAFRV